MTSLPNPSQGIDNTRQAIRTLIFLQDRLPGMSPVPEVQDNLWSGTRDENPERLKSLCEFLALLFRATTPESARRQSIATSDRSRSRNSIDIPAAILGAS